MKPQNRIIICGYPKSGSTWLTRLTADVVGCPVAGFWNQPRNNEIAIEGENRVSDFVCYKSHHSYCQLLESFMVNGNNTEKVIYIVRDPRDVIVSALHYFNKPFAHPILFYLMKFFRIEKQYSSRYRLAKKRIDRMTDFLLYGTKKLPWMHNPWSEHVESYLRSEALLIRYEDLLEKPLEEMEKVLNYLELMREQAEVLKSIESQSFETKKRAFTLRNDRKNSSFMRSGRAGDWKNYLSEEQNSRIADHLKELMVRLGYPHSGELC